MRAIVVGLALATCWPSIAAAQTATSPARVERISAARVSIENTCAKATAQEMSSRSQEAGGLAAALAPAALDFIGDIAGAGLGLVATAIERASAEHAYGGQGLDVFNFYSLDVTGSGANEQVQFQPNIGGSHNRCLIIEVPAAPQRGLGWREGLYVEALLATRADGFEVLPLYVEYPLAIAHAPNRALPAELHVTFSYPDPTKADLATSPVFAIAMIGLPPLQPGAPSIRARDLRPYRSGVMPLRPLAGRAETARTAVTQAYAAVVAKRAEIRRLREVDLVAARRAAAARGASAAARARLGQIQDQIAAGEFDLERLSEAAHAAMNPDEQAVELGSVNVQARVVLIRSPNQFGLAVANAIRENAPQFGQAVTRGLTPHAAWNAAETAYTNTRLDVDAKQADLDHAVATGASAEDIARLTRDLRRAQATANAAAVEAGRDSVPFPEARY